jgi:NAD(P)-dependent dehydrogenase (short-subunit alcohol dehydrogenase family)
MAHDMIRKTAIVTGASKGIGRAIALKLASQSYNLVLNYASDTASAQETLHLCQQLTTHVHLIQADVTRRKEVEHLVDETYELFGSVDALINNAGLNRDRALQELDDEDWDRVVDTNMKSVFLCAQRAAAYMLQQTQGGVIINLSATTALRGRPNGLNYCASKAGVLVMTKCLALELAPRIRVNCLIPGFTNTDEVVKRFNLTDLDTLQAVKERIPLRHVAEPEEIAQVASFLLSDEARQITGQKIIVDGGEYMF